MRITAIRVIGGKSRSARATATSSQEAMAALELSPEHLVKIGQAGRERAITDHTAGQRARELEQLLEEARTPMEA